MAFDVRLACIYAFAALLPFFFVQRLTHETPPPSSVEIAQWIERVASCPTHERRSISCTLPAAELLQRIYHAEARTFLFHRQSHFAVHILGAYMVLNRPKCVPGDVAVDEFHWRIWPVELAQLDEAWRPHGFRGSILYFSKSGIVTNDACVLVLKLPITPIKALEIGQFDRTTQHWPWRVYDNL